MLKKPMLMEKNEKREELHVKLHAPSTKEVPERKSHWSDNLFYLYFSIFFKDIKIKVRVVLLKVPGGRLTIL